MNPRKILVALDESTNSNTIIDALKNNIATPSDYITLVNVYSVPHLPVAIPGGAGNHNINKFKDFQELAKDLEIQGREESQKILDKGKKKLIGFTVECKTLVGDAKYVLEEMVRNSDYDLIVMGKRGMSTVSRLFMGSVSNYVSNHSQVPVILIPQVKTEQ